MLSPIFYIQAVALALSQIWANRMRSFLTTLGIIIGVASVTAVVAALTGLKTKVLTEFQTLGANKLFIFPDRPDDAPRNLYPWREIRLKPQELDELTEHCPSVRFFTPVTNLGATVESPFESLGGVSITGIWPEWHIIENRNILIGRPFSAIDEENERQVCLINEEAIRELHLNTDPTGQHILLNGRRFLVVGVVDTLQATIFNRATTQSEVFIPFSTAVKMQDPDFFFFITGQITTPEVAEEAKAEARFVLRRTRELKAGAPDTFEVHAIDQFIEQFRAMATGITAIAGGIVAISLLVGGIGIMNIMLVSVSERTREIGLRKAVGATPAAILTQFLLEAVTLSFLGGFAGLGAGEVFALALAHLPGVELKEAGVPWWAVVMSFAFSAAVGVIFGMFPAVKAARLDPIDALRHE
jgi:putative ABC transport system permease protein